MLEDLCVKHKFLMSIAKDLIDCEDYPKDFNESVWEKLPPDPRQTESEKVKLARIEADKAATIEKDRIEAEYRERAEIEKAKIQPDTRRMELQFRRDFDENRRNEFDLTKYVKLVPQFNESEVEQGKSEGFESCDRPIVRKRPIWVKIGDVLSRVTLKFDG